MHRAIDTTNWRQLLLCFLNSGLRGSAPGADQRVVMLIRLVTPIPGTKEFDPTRSQQVHTRTIARRLHPSQELESPGILGAVQMDEALALRGTPVPRAPAERRRLALEQPPGLIPAVLVERPTAHGPIEQWPPLLHIIRDTANLKQSSRGTLTPST
jgi:hypothetical protein